MNVCKPHEVHECQVCWPGGWTMGLDAASNRLETHLAGKPNTRFDARDRQALTFLLVSLRRMPLPDIPRSMRSEVVQRIAFLLRKREAHKTDLQLKFEDQDWHGVADAAMDLRDVDCELAGLRY